MKPPHLGRPEVDARSSSSLGIEFNLFSPGGWVSKGIWTITDEGLFASSNFVLNVLLARWLTPQDFGAFTVAFMVFLLLSAFHTALFTEPMLVFGPRKFRDRLSEYLGLLLYGHVGFAALASLVLLMAGVGVALWGSRPLASALLSLACAGPFILFLWLMRSASYVRLEPQYAALGGALYMVLMLVGVYALYRQQWLSTVSALGTMAVASLAAGLWLVLRLQVRRPPVSRNQLVRDTFGAHWGYGRWAVASTVITLVPGDIYYSLLLPVWGGLAATAAFRALTNLILPIQHATSALSVLLVPTLAHTRGDPRFTRLVRWALGVFTFGTVSYWVLLSLFHRSLVTWLYGGRYLEHGGLLLLLGAWPVVGGVISVLGGTLRALERPDRIFWASGLSTVIALTAGLGLVAGWGIVGAAVGLLLGSMVRAVAMGVFYRRLRGSRTLGDQRGAHPNPVV